MADVDFGELRAADGLKVSVPGKMRRQVLGVGDAHLVVYLFGIAALHIGHGGFGQRGFDSENGLGLAAGLLLGVAAQRKQFGDVLEILLAQLLGFVVVARVVVTVGQSQATLVGFADDFRAVFEVLIRAVGEEHANSLGLQARAGREQTGGVVHGVDGGKIGGDRLQPLRIDFFGIHATGVEIADFLLVRTGRSRSIRGGGL